MAATRSSLFVYLVTRVLPVPIVALTAHAFEDEHERIMAAGMNDFLPKPVPKARLLKTVATWVRRGRGLETAPAPAPPAPAETGAPSASVSPDPVEPDAALPPVFDPEVLDRLGEETDVSVLPELVGTFLTHGEERCRAIAEAGAAGDLARLGEDAHALKSSAATFGAMRLSRQAAALERAAKAGEVAAATGCATAIAETVPPTWSALEAYLAALPATAS